MKPQPLVSIIIPTYNRAHLIGETLDSVLAQTYKNWECIIVDDGSTDNTDEVVGEYIKKDKRFKYYHRPDEHLPGGNGARNYGFKMSKGEYVNWLDSDDLFSKDKIEEQIKVAIGNKSDIVTCKWRMIKKEISSNLAVYRDYNNPFNFFDDLYFDYGYLPNHSYLIKRKLLELHNLWNEYLKINQDGVMFVQLLYNARNINFSKKGYCIYRETSADSISYITDNKIKQYISTIKLIEEIHRLSLNGGLPQNFEVYKWKSFLRVPNNYKKKLDKESLFFYDEIKRFNSEMSLKRKAKNYIKKYFNVTN